MQLSGMVLLPAALIHGLLRSIAGISGASFENVNQNKQQKENSTD